LPQQSQQIWKHQRVEEVRPPNTNQTDALELRSRDESNTLVTKPCRVNRTRPFRIFESQTRNYCKVSTSLSHPISYWTTKTNNNRTNRIIKAYKQPKRRRRQHKTHLASKTATEFHNHESQTKNSYREHEPPALWDTTQIRFKNPCTPRCDGSSKNRTLRITQQGSDKNTTTREEDPSQNRDKLRRQPNGEGDVEVWDHVTPPRWESTSCWKDLDLKEEVGGGEFGGL